MRYSFIRNDEINVDKLKKVISKDKKTVLEFFLNYDVSFLLTKPYFEEVIKLLYYSCNKNELEILINKDDILELFIKSNMFDILGFFSKKTSIKVLNKLLELGEDTEFIVSIYRCFDFEIQEELLYLLKSRSDVLIRLAERCDFKIASKIFNDNLLDFATPGIGVEGLFSCGKEDYIDKLRCSFESGCSSTEYQLLPKVLTDESIELIWDTYNIYKIRSIINDAIYVTNSTIINDYVKRKEDKLILSSLNGLLPLYESVYQKYLLQLEINDLGNADEDEDYFRNLYKFKRRLRATMSVLELEVFEDIEKSLNSINKESLLDFIILLNNETISNYIIDYHFEENYYNIELDIKELIGFYNRGHIELDSIHLELYKKILEIDNLSLEDKVKLHLELKKYNMMEILYDDMLKARRIVNNDIMKNALNSKNIKKYKDEELSKYYGVDIYVVKDTELCALAKSDRKYKNEIPIGYSYSLVGDRMIGTYKPILTENYIYDALYLNQDQIMHIYPEDSYTTPPVFGSDESSSIRVNKLLLSSELLKEDSDYSEILVLEKGSISTPIDDDIPSMPVLAIYCQDEYINPSMVELAKKDGIGIVYVKKTIDKRFKSGVRTKNNISNVYYNEMFFTDFNKERRNIK